MDRPSIIVSGANGYLGLLMLRKLNDQGCDIISLIHPKDNRHLEEVSHFSSRVLFTDFSDLSFQNNLPLSATCFIHFAWAGVNGKDKGSASIQQKNVEMAMTAAKAAVNCGCARFIGIGTISELAEYHLSEDMKSPSTVYAEYKNECRERLSSFFRERPCEFIWLRLSNLYGASNKTGNILSYAISAWLADGTAEFGPCNQYYDFLLAEDAIEAIYRFSVLRGPFTNDTYFIGSGKPAILKTFLETAARAISPDCKVGIGKRKDDGMEFKKELFSVDETIDAIGPFVSMNFEQAIKEVIAMAIKEQ